MPTFYDSYGISYVLTHEIGRGGEGTVFFVPHDLTLVAKIYHTSVDVEKAEKLRWMAANKNDGLLKIAAWIIDTLHDENGEIVGFLMPNVKAKEIHELYSLKSRRVHFPEATWQFLIHTAANVARAFYVLHKNEHIMGDVNHGNCVVLADGTVKLIDCDSYSIKTEARRYRCDVGVATHLAPELQGVDLSEVDRRPTHDNFGLAVIIFQLLFLGRHPFSGNYLGAEDKSLEDCIRERRFAYGNRTVTQVKQPPGTLSLSHLPLRLALMFTAAFMTQNRPEPREWVEALEDLSENLKTCQIHIGHHYFDYLTTCPWCEMEAKTGLILFPYINSGIETDEGKFNILTIENLINQMAPAQILPLQPSQFPFVIQSSPEALDCRKNKRSKIVKIVFAQFLGLTFMTFVFGGALTFFLSLIILGITVYVFYQQHHTVKHQFQREFKVKQESWQDINIEWNNFNSSAEKFSLEVSKIKRQLNEYRKLHDEKAKQIKQLSHETFQEQLKIYLSSFKLADLKHPLIEKVHYDIFNRYNLKTAAEVDENRLSSLLAIKAQINSIINQWRKDLENQFTDESLDLLPAAAKNLVELEYSGKRRDIESNIESLLGTLRSTSTTLQQMKLNLANNAEKAYREVSQAQRDLITVGGTASLTVMMILMTIFVPFFGSVFQNAFFTSQRKKQIYDQPPPMQKLSNGQTISARPDGSGSGYGNVTNSASMVTADYPVNENLTDAEIERMSAEEKMKSAQSLYSQALPLMNAKLYPQAEKKLRLAVKLNKLAVKLDEFNIKILYTLGTTLYEQKKYELSLMVLEDSLKIDKTHQETKLLIGANYLRMKRYEEAQRHFFALKREYPTSFEPYFNLGQTYMSLKNYYQAEYHFEKAVSLKPADIDAHYQYGLALYKNDKIGEAAREYQKLFDLGAKKEAERLGKFIFGNASRPPEKRVVTKSTEKTQEPRKSLRH